MKRSTAYILGTLSALIIVFAAGVASAQVSIDFPSAFAGFSSQDIKVTISNIVRIVLGFVGVIFLLLILYGGFVWMFSRGEADKINRAKKIIASAVIGLLVTLAAYSIASFVVNSLRQAVSPAPPTNPFCGVDGNGDGSLLDPGESCDHGFQNGMPGFCNSSCTGIVPLPANVCQKDDNGTADPADDPVQVCDLQGGSALGSVIRIRGWNFGLAVGKVYFEGTCGGAPCTVEAAILAQCSGMGSQWSAADAGNGWSVVKAIVPATLDVGNIYNVIVEKSSGERCTTTNTCQTRQIINTSAPSIYCIYPQAGETLDGDPATEKEIRITGNKFGTTRGSIQMNGTPGIATIDDATNRIKSWQDEEIKFDLPDLPSTAYSAPAEEAVSGDVIVTDSGAIQSNPEYYQVTCGSTGGNCASGCCYTNQCSLAATCAGGAPGGPIITNILPNTGAPGNLVTIQGRNFGNAAGRVLVTDSSGAAFTVGAPSTCSAWWSDTQVILEVPAASLGATTIQLRTGGASPMDSNVWATFRVDAIQRPGLCAPVNPPQGPPLSTVFTVTGKQFGAAGATRDLFFGPVPPAGDSASGQSFNLAADPQTGSGIVPNLRPGQTTIALKVDSEISNPVNFLVEPAGAGNPVVYSVSPENGPDGTYITISGSGFGTLPGLVWFQTAPVATLTAADADASGTRADVNFPAQCSTRYWADDHVVVKAPIGLVDQAYFLLVQNVASANFSQNASLPGVNRFVNDATDIRPGVCRIDPIGGPAGTPVDYFGDNFGSNTGEAWFDKLVDATAISSWDNKQVIDAQVPDASVTGTTTVQRIDGAGDKWGNPLPFFVGRCEENAQCGTGNECCADGTCRPAGGCSGGLNFENNPWSFVTDVDPFDLVDSLSCTVDVQSPSPYPYDQVGSYVSTDPDTNAPVNSVIIGRFSRDIDIATIQANVKIYKCNQGASFDESACGNVTNAANFSKIGYGAWRYTPGLMDDATWYQIRLDVDTGIPTSNIRATDGSLYEGSAFLGADGTLASYRWRFRTRATGQPLCDVDALRLTPNTQNPPVGGGPLIVPVGSTAGPLTALPTSSQCYVCDGSSFNYDWTIANPAPPAPPYALFSPLPAPPATSPSGDSTEFEGENISPGPVPVRVDLTNPPSGTPLSATGQISVEHVPPRVVSHSPSSQCTTVCRNAVPVVRFNQQLEAAATGRVWLRECTDSNCTGVTGTVETINVLQPAATAGQYEIVLTPRVIPLKSGTWYRVVVSDGVRNLQSQNLVGLNYDDNSDGTNDSYSWKFQTSLTQCDPDTVAVAPAVATINALGSTQHYSASASANVCGSMRLNPYAFDWAWTSSDPLIAAFQTLRPNPGPGAGQSPVQTITALQQGTVTVQASVPNPSVATILTGSLTVNDLREPLNLIGHRPDLPSGATPPESAATGCLLGGNPSDCTLQCTNVLASALFSTSLDPRSVNSSNFYVAEYASGAPVPGTTRVYNYTDPTRGICSANPSKECTTVACGPGEGVCSFTRGRVDFIPDIGGASFSVNPLLRYNFDDGTANNKAGNGFDGTFVQGATVTTGNPTVPELGIGAVFDRSVNIACSTDATNRCVNFPADNDSCRTAGGECIGSRIDIPDDLSVPADATVTAWFKTNSITHGNQYIYSSIGPGGGEYLGMKISGRRFNGLTDIGGAYQNCDIQGSTNLVPDRWYFASFVVQGSKLSLYLDGKLDATADIANPADPQNLTGACPIQPAVFTSSMNRIADDGANWFAGSFDGEIDDVRLYGKALSFSEINQVRVSGLGQSFIKGTYAPATEYQVRICDAGSCTASPIKSAQGIAYATPQTYGFETGTNVCKISFIEVTPNPAAFADRLRECTGATAQCQDTTPKTIVAQAKDATGLDLGAIDYTWRTTTDGAPAGTYQSNLYQLNYTPPSGIASVRHKGVQGTDTGLVSAKSSAATLDLGRATTTALFNFSFCENPWYGQGNSPFYLDSEYDFKLSYCMDAKGPNPSAPEGRLPALPSPHIERDAVGFNTGGDLLKEHIFIVGSTVNVNSSIDDTKPYFISPQPVVKPKYREREDISLKLEAKDDEGDSFQFTMQGEAGPDALPPSVSFNPRTGSFSWLIDKIPTTDSAADTDTLPDFDITFRLNPGGAAPPNDTRRLILNVEPGTAPLPVSRPKVQFTSPAQGSSTTVTYGQTLSFTARLDATGPGGGFGQNASSIKSFVWDFQDSGLSSYTSVTAPTYTADHVFLQTGLHQVTFRVQNDLGIWSDPAVVNVTVLPKTSFVPRAARPLVATWLRQQLLGALVGRALGQTILSAPSQLTATTIKQAPATIQLKWKNNGSYDAVKVYRDGAVLPGAAALPGTTTSFDDPAVIVGTSYVYSVCGVIATEEKCSDITTVARNVDYDIIVARVYKNLNSLSVEEWYRTYAPNATGSIQKKTIDGYDAIVDGTSVYVGVANCTNPTDCSGSGASGIYTNILLFSYNLGAKESTVDIFNQLLANLRVNDSLTVRDDFSTTEVCSGDPTLVCNPGYDAACAAKNAGLCQSAKAELRRDHKRIVDLHDIAASLDVYAQAHHFCDDGTNTIACNTDADCPLTGAAPTARFRCIGVYPALTSGSYLGGISTSRSPSWNQSLAKELAVSALPTDPINRFGANFYSLNPASCSEFPGFDANTCWNERSSQFRCHDGSEVYVYRNAKGTNMTLYGLAEAQGWNWISKDPRIKLDSSSYAGLCTSASPTGGSCGNGVVEPDKTRAISITIRNPRVNSNTAVQIKVGAGLVVNPGIAIPVYDGTQVITDSEMPTAGGLNVRRMVGPNGAPRIQFYLGSEAPKDYEARITLSEGSVGGLTWSSSVFDPLTGLTNSGLEGNAVGNCSNASNDLLSKTSSTELRFCMETAAAPDNFYLDINFPGEVCDGGSINYCDLNLGSGNWNNDFKVGCKADCSGWGDPFPGGAAAACGGACGDGTVNAGEACDPGLAGSTSGWQCTAGGSIYCSNSCQMACTAGRPYSGRCGDGSVTLPEVCDEAGLNGQPGHCNTSCTGYDAFCGDGALTPLTEYSLGCACDSTINNTSCSTNYKAVAGSACAASCGTAHQWSCVANVEECDGVVGLTAYSCPASSALYCDTKCNRACTGIDDTGGLRNNVAVYEHYASQGTTLEDHDYTTLKKADTPYDTKGIAFYAYNPGTVGANLIDIYRFKSTTSTISIVDRSLSRNAARAGYVSQGVAFRALDSAVNANVVPVYEFRITKSNTSVDYYYSRNVVPRKDAAGNTYNIQNGGLPVFYAYLGPFQESCGNDVIEGNEVCEPDVYQIPTASQSSLNQQYACGQPFTPNACRSFGGYCGDGTKDSPFEQCDEGTDFTCALDSTVTCEDDTDCTRSTCTAAGRCAMDNTVRCTKDSDCPQNTCNGNGALCNNNGGNCTYCAKACTQTLVPRNYCGDGIVNCGINTPNDCTDQDPYTEVCDDGVANNGKPGQCNETCSGRTGAVCGNGLLEQVCSADPSNNCSDAALQNECATKGGTCGGERCDDGTNNGRWSYLCQASGTCSGNGAACTVDNNCPAGQTCVGAKECTLDAAGDQICDMADDGLDNNSKQCGGTAKSYCAFSCLGRTPAVCGDGIVQQPNDGPDRLPGTSDDRQELCDHGIKNGSAGYCNATCDGISPAICGDSIVGSGTCANSRDIFGAPQLCQTYTDCSIPGDTCLNGESCDPPASQAISSCTDTAGRPGLRNVQCSSSCQALDTQCHAYGLKIWSDGVDVAYLNGSLMILKPQGAPQCSTDPDLQTANYSTPASPPSSTTAPANQCGTPVSQVPNQEYSAASDVRPIDASGQPVAATFERNGKNVVAVKVWAPNAVAKRSFLAVYTSPTARRMFPTLSGQLSDWSCSHAYTPGWEGVTCPDNLGKCSNSTNGCSKNADCGAGGTCGPDGKSDCDPSVAANTWRRPFSYTNDTASINQLCNTNYPNYFGATGTAQWIWGDRCAGECTGGTRNGQSCNAAADCSGGGVCNLAPAKHIVYCRLDYTSAGSPPQAAWNPSFGWIHLSTAGSRVVIDATDTTWPKALKGSAWNRNLGWLHFDGTDAANGTANPTSGVQIEADGTWTGEAWGVNYGTVYFNPKNSCGGSVCSDTGLACTGAAQCTAPATCDPSNCNSGFGTQAYLNVRRDPAQQTVSGYAWSEKAGWIDFGAYQQTRIYIPEL